MVCMQARTQLAGFAVATKITKVLHRHSSCMATRVLSRRCDDSSIHLPRDGRLHELWWTVASGLEMSSFGRDAAFLGVVCANFRPVPLSDSKVFPWLSSDCLPSESDHDKQS